jgi:hypothetical protein
MDQDPRPGPDLDVDRDIDLDRDLLGFDGGSGRRFTDDMSQIRSESERTHG